MEASLLLALFVSLSLAEYYYEAEPKHTWWKFRGDLKIHLINVGCPGGAAVRAKCGQPFCQDLLTRATGNLGRTVALLDDTSFCKMCTRSMVMTLPATHPGSGCLFAAVANFSY
jgi:hypothetical protein